MRKVVQICFLLFMLSGINKAFAQDLKTSVGTNKELDSVRKKLDGGKDSVVFTAKYIRFTKLSMSKDSIVLLPLDTTTVNIQNYSPLLQPMHPTISTGNMGLAARPLLFEPSKRIGFDVGFHSFDYYALTPEDIIYYQARTPFTSLYFVSAGKTEQLFRAIHTQNIKKNWNVGVNFNRADSKGFYARQRGDNLNVAVFSWYQSPSKRYNMWASAIFNTMRGYENGSVVAKNIFDPGYNKISRDGEAINLSDARNMYKKNTVFLKQTYYVGRIDTSANANNAVLPTNKVTYTFEYNNESYDFYKNGTDPNNVLPPGINSTTFTNDSTHVQHIKNEFIYSFFLRPKNSSLIKNELKVDAASNDFNDNAKNNVGFNVTAFGDFGVGNNFFIQPGVSLQNKGNKFESVNTTTGLGNTVTTTSSIKTNLMTIEVPVNAVLRIPTGDAGAVQISAGPYIGFNISGKDKGENVVTTVNNANNNSATVTTSNDRDLSFGSANDKNYNSTEFGANFGLAYRTNSGFLVGANYGLGLTDLTPKDRQANTNKLTNRVLGFSVGYSF
jgi:hypothetical protein